MLTDLTLHMMIPTYHMAKSSGCVSNELVWIVALASSSTIRNKSLFYQKIELTLTLTLPLTLVWWRSGCVQLVPFLRPQDRIPCSAGDAWHAALLVRPQVKIPPNYK